MSQSAVLKALCDAVTETIDAAGSGGAPGGVLYAALMTTGMTLDQFEALMSALVRSGSVRQSGHLYFTVKAKG